MNRHLVVIVSLLLGVSGCVGRVEDVSLTTDDAPDAARDDAAPLRPDVSAADAVDAEPPRDAEPPADDARADAASQVSPDAPEDRAPSPPDAPATPQCAGSASGQSDVWACTADRSARQRCVRGVTETARCAYGCVGASGGAVCGCGSMAGFTVWNCLSSGNLGRCRGGAWEEQSCGGNGCSARPTGVDDVCNGPPPPPGALMCSNLQWWNATLTYQHMSSGWLDTDLRVAAGTPVQLRHGARLDRHGVYGWGYMPEFTDMVTGLRFRFLHLRPQNQYATTVGRVYPAGFIVGLSGGNTTDTGYPSYSTGSHLCVQTLVPYRNAFPGGTDACR